MPPNGGWHIQIMIKDQEFTFTGSPGRIVDAISALQIKNAVYTGEDDIWEYCNKVWCDRDPARCIKGELPQSHISMKSKVLTFAHALSSLVKNGLKPVDQKDADRRALVCSKCPKNRNMESCASCVATVNAITKTLLGSRNTSYDRKLKDCGVCGCNLKQKIHFPLNDGDTNVYPSFCWVTKEKNE